MTDYEYVFQARPRRSGKSRLRDYQAQYLLDQGYSVLFCTSEGDTLRRKHRSGLVVITPVPRSRSRYAEIDDET